MAGAQGETGKLGWRGMGGNGGHLNGLGVRVGIPRCMCLSYAKQKA